MKTLSTFLIITFLFNINLFSQEKFQYISPVKNSKLVSLSSTIILGSKDKIDFSTVAAKKIIVTGSKSGIHKGKVKLANDSKTIIFIPSSKFAPNEKVSVDISSGIKTTKEKELAPVSFHFTTTPLSKPIAINPLSIISEDVPYRNLTNNIPSYNFKKSESNLDTLPSDFPMITIDSVDNPAPGKIFMANFLGPDSIGSFLMIVNDDGSIEKYKRLDNYSFDFRVQPNGYLSYADVIELNGGIGSTRWIVMDTTFTPVDTFQCGNGYEADIHEFRLLPNGHGLMFAYDAEPVDMSLIVDGGNPNATVYGTILQEVDTDNNVIFQWRSWDYIPITESYANLTRATIDYMHTNAADVDQDGNYLISAHTLSQIIKIDRATGNVIWKLGGKSNQFMFMNENEANAPTYFSYQHNITVLPNGDVTLFDNGSQHSPPYSRGVEYQLDEQNKIATLVWEYRHSPDIFAAAMGNVQRLPNGNSLIGWGIASLNGSPALTEVHPDGSVAFELSLPMGITSYRSFRFPWTSQLPQKTNTQYEILQGNTYTFDDPGDTTGITIKFNQLNAFIYNSVTATVFGTAPANTDFTGDAPKVAKQYFNLTASAISSFEGEVTLEMQYFSSVTEPANRIVYLRAKDSSYYKPLPTSYDSSKNEITFTTTGFGDFAFCKPLSVDSAYSPIPIEPVDEEIVNVEDSVQLMWGTRGIVSNCSLQVSLDSLFTNLIVDQTLSSTSFQIGNLNNNSRYFWRVSTTNSAGESEWSDPSSFVTSSPFINVSYPNGSDTLYADSTYIIRWDDNLQDMVRIELIKNGTVASIIADSVLSETNAYKWEVPSSVAEDSTYKIKITDINNENLSDLSDNTFSINGGVVGVNDNNNAVKEYRLFQNYPNPFNPSTVIEFALPAQSNVTISVFNIIGQKVAVLFKGTENAGNHSVTWNAQNLSSGVYFYKIDAVGINNKNNSFTSFKKAILIK